MSGITQFQGGFPFSVLMADDRNGDGIADRPDVTGKPVIESRNPSCYIVDSCNLACGVTSTAFADLPDRPWPEQLEPGIAKNTWFHERYKLQFRAELFNFFNHAAFNTPSPTVNVTAPRFGVITSAGRPREMQFGLKLQF